MKLNKWLAPVLSLSLLFPTITGATSASAAEPKIPTVETPAIELRATLDYLLSEHFTLAVDSMIKKYDNSFDAAAAQTALEKNAKDMVPAIASVYGEKGAREFDRIFSGHLNYTKDYVTAVKSNNAADKTSVAKEIEQFAIKLGNFLGTATAGKLPASAAQDVLRKHEDQVKQVFDDYVAGNYTSSLAKYREGLSFMFVISDALSGAIVTQMPDKFNGTRPDTSAGDLRSALNYLAAEHYALAVISMQKGMDKSPAYPAILEAENGNTVGFTEAITSLYGAAGGEAFKTVWFGDHINAQDEIVKASLAGDANASMQARAKLSKFSVEFGNFLGAATGGKLPASAATAAIAEHERLVLEAFDLYRAKDASGLYASYDKGYNLMFGVGKALGGAIVMQKPDFFQSEFPVTEPETSNEVQTIWLQINGKTAKVNGNNVEMDVAPLIKDTVTFVSLRTLTMALGADLRWSPSTATVEVDTGTDKVVFWLGKDIAQVNGENVNLMAPVFAHDGRTQVPLRFIAELLGWNLNWNKADWSITLTKAM
ncbi:copper amine oxidase N-terminal domain-containing protein [Cohnella herbarum]|uniref:Copper amine oxidase N-terminal domain-containing protein n=1 Tax=Cohnella herbarum TaxID=2728023 RepID=A0A7Z2VHG7_9BACL|nr:copper amine oxidase N-terminal domain-containing protein [Cohnella herbarum]QJD82964.1 copper amine oxidase N-terminal domain-containing protein [Cohnella herbarum]